MNVVTIIIVALLALAVGFIAGGLLGITYQAKNTGEAIGLFLTKTVDGVTERIELMQKHEEERKAKLLEDAVEQANQTMNRLERLKEMQESMCSMPNPFLDLAQRIQAERNRREAAKEQHVPPMQTMGDRFNELWGGGDKEGERPTGDPKPGYKEEE